MEFCHVQCSQSARQGFRAHAEGRRGAFARRVIQVRQQSRLVAAGKFVFHERPKLRATRRTERADSTARRCMLTSSFLRPLELERASFFKDKRRTLTPSRVWA